MEWSLINWSLKKTQRPEEVEDYLDPTEYGESSKKAHCSSNQAQLGLKRHLQVLTKVSEQEKHKFS